MRSAFIKDRRKVGSKDSIEICRTAFSVDGLSTQDELFAVRLLELARLAAPQGNRVAFVQSCENGRIRRFLERFSDVWEQITDKPVREGIASEQEYASKWSAYSLQSAAFQELVKSQLDLAEIRHLWLGGLSLAHLLYGDISEREFHGLQLLVSPQDVAQTQKILRGIGFATPSSLGEGQKRALVRWGHQESFRHDQTDLSLSLQWRLFSPWIGRDLRPFDDLFAHARDLSWEGLSDWTTLGEADTILYLAMTGYESGWSRMQRLLDLAVALESLDYTWDQVKALAGPRAVLLERAVEMTVRLLGIPHPQKMTYHFSDYEHTLASWMEWQKNQETPGRELLSAGYWSCEPSQALRYRFEAALTPEPEVIREVALPDRFSFLYPLIHILRLLWRRD